MTGLLGPLADDIVAIVFFPVTIMLIFTLHELGHYAAARLCGVRVLSFTVGMGPRLWQGSDRRGTLWTLRLMPLCGLVRLAGQQAAEHADPGAQSGPGDQFGARPLWQRALIVVAGPLANLLLAVIFLGVFFTVAGRPLVPATVAGVDINSPAHEAGIRPGDIITAVDGRPAADYETVRRIVNRAARAGVPVVVALTRDGQAHRFVVQTEWHAYTDLGGFAREQGRTGILFMAKPLLYSAISHVAGKVTADEAAVRAALRPHEGARAVMRILAVDGETHEYEIDVPRGAVRPGSDGVRLGTGDGTVYAALPVTRAWAAAARETARMIRGAAKIVRQMWPIDSKAFAPEFLVPRPDDPLRYDFFTLACIGAFMSVCVGLFNLLPLPRLDGGALVALATEAVIGPQRAHVIAPYVVRCTMLALCAVVVFVNAADFFDYMDKF
jgi:membrane-associated protease RseP (regulator of RpoE activity)